MSQQLSEPERERLKALILARSGTVYAFCRDYGLPGGTVYQVLRGRYAGHIARQAARIEDRLKRGPVVSGGPDMQELIKAIGLVACAHCDYGKRRCRRERPKCRALWKEQARAARKVWEKV